MNDTSKEFLAGIAAGFVGKIVEYPLDTVKVLLQTQSSDAYSGTMDCIKQTVKERGFFGLYRGLSSPLAGSMAEVAVLMASFGTMKRWLGESKENPVLPMWKIAIAGAWSGFCVSHVLTPVELVKCRLQVQQGKNHFIQNPYKGPIDVISRTIKEEGFRGMFRGHSSMLLREIPGNIAWYGAYEGTCRILAGNKPKSEMSPLVFLAAGGMSGFWYWTAFFPADTVKSKIQTTPALKNKSFGEVFLKVAKEEGARGLYKGWGITVARAMPSHAAIFLVYEMFASLFGIGK